MVCFFVPSSDVFLCLSFLDLVVILWDAEALFHPSIHPCLKLVRQNVVRPVRQYHLFPLVMESFLLVFWSSLMLHFSLSHVHTEWT